MADVRAELRGQNCRIFVYDLSMDGCMLQTSRIDMAEGESILLHFAKGCSAEGRVLWKKNITAGVKFDGRLEARTVEALLKAVERNSYARSLGNPLDRKVLVQKHRSVDRPKLAP